MKYVSFIDSDHFGSGPFTSRVFFEVEIQPRVVTDDREIYCSDEKRTEVQFTSLHPDDQKRIHLQIEDAKNHLERLFEALKGFTPWH